MEVVGITELSFTTFEIFTGHIIIPNEYNTLCKLYDNGYVINKIELFGHKITLLIIECDKHHIQYVREHNPIKINFSERLIRYIKWRF